MATKNAGSITDEEYACRLLKDHLTKQALSAFHCKVNQQDPPDLIVTWPNGLQWGVEVIRVYHQVPGIVERARRFGRGTKKEPTLLAIEEQAETVSSEQNIALLRSFAEDLKKSTENVRKLEYSFFLEGAGPFSSWHKQHSFKKWKKENEPKIREHIESGDASILEIPGVRLKPGKPGKRFSILPSAGIHETSSAMRAMLKCAIEKKAKDLPSWNGLFAERWLLLLNYYPLVDDFYDVRDTLRKLVFANENLAGFDGVFWSGYVDRSLRQLKLDPSMKWPIECGDCGQITLVPDIVELIDHHLDGHGRILCGHCGNPGYIGKTFEIQKNDTPYLKPYIRGIIPGPAKRDRTGTYRSLTFLASSAPDQEPQELWLSSIEDTRSEGGRLKMGHGPGGPPVFTVEEALDLIAQMVRRGCLDQDKAVDAIRAAVRG